MVQVTMAHRCIVPMMKELKTAIKSIELQIKVQHVWQNSDSKISYTAL